jgi:hypothetical protein
MAKAPVPGRVKTRLCPPLTPDEAAEYAAAALADTLEAVAASNADDKVLALEGEPGAWLPAGFRVVAQRGSSFNERLAHAWDDAGGPGVQIGMDTPQVTPDLLDGALGQVRPGRALLGPTPDGGWWALGLAAPDDRVFDGVPMSRYDTGIWQRARLTQLGYAVHDLESLVDVDHFEDAVAVAADAPRTRAAAALDRVCADRFATTLSSVRVCGRFVSVVGDRHDVTVSADVPRAGVP